MTAVTKLQMNPPDNDLGQVIQEKGAVSYQELSALGVLQGKCALVVGGTRGVGYGTALALAKSGAASVTVVGRSETSGARAVSRIQEELPEDSLSKITFMQGDIGTVASTNELIQKLSDRTTRYDYLIVSAAIFPQPHKTNPSPLNNDGVEKAFGIGVVGRFLLYRNAHTFMKRRNGDDSSSDSGSQYSPVILNVCAAGGTMPFGFDRTLVRSLASNHMNNIVNFAIGNELMLHKLVEEEKGNSDGSRFDIPIITTHPGFLQTDLHRGQGIILDIAETILVHFMGCTEEECGRREVSLLCAIGSKEKKPSSSSLLTIIDNFGFGRLINSRMDQDLKEHGAWLWTLLLEMEIGGRIAENS